jgi:hypothetical protein
MSTAHTAFEARPETTGKPNQQWPRLLALGAVAGPALFTAAWIILGAISPGYTVAGTWISPYSPITQPISGLGLGETGPYMNSVFVISGLLLLTGVIGVVRTLPPGGRPVGRVASLILLALSPIGLIVIGFFTLDAALMHTLGAMLILATPVISFLVTGLHVRRLPGWRALGNGLMMAAPLTLVLFVAYTMSFNQAAVAAGHGIAGLTQRVLFVEIWTWFVAMGWHAWRPNRRSVHRDSSSAGSHRSSDL